MHAIPGAKSLLAIDPSLSSTGWALFDLKKQRLAAVGHLSAPRPQKSITFETRLALMQEEISHLVRHTLRSGDLLVCEEAAPLQLNPHTAMKVERVRGIFETLARELGVSVPGRINPRTIHVELLGLRGNQLNRTHVKQIARRAAWQIFSKQLKSLDSNFTESSVVQDIIDALLVGAVAINRVVLAQRLGVEVSSQFAPKRPRESYRTSLAKPIV